MQKDLSPRSAQGNVALDFPLERDVEVFDTAMHLISAADNPSATIYRIEAPGLSRVDLKRDALHRLVVEGRWLNSSVLDAWSIYLNAIQGTTRSTFVVETMFFTRLTDDDVGYTKGKLWSCFRVSCFARARVDTY